MKFSEQIIKKSQPILEAIIDHPFVKGIGEGQLPKESLAFYVGQDYNYLNAFMKVYAAAIQKSDNREQIQLFTDQIEFTLNSEIQAHVDFCNIAGVNYDDLKNESQAPMTYLYNEHMYNAARTGDLIDIVAAMTPCPWTYSEICKYLIAQGKATENNPFKSWIDFYAGTDSSELALSEQLMNILDDDAKKYSSDRLKIVEERFLQSCELEWRFWDQAYSCSGWKFL